MNNTTNQNANETAVFATIPAAGTIHVYEIQRITQLDNVELNAAIVGLRAKEMIARTPGGDYSRTPNAEFIVAAIAAFDELAYNVTEIAGGEFYVESELRGETARFQITPVEIVDADADLVFGNEPYRAIINGEDCYIIRQ